MKIIDGGVTAAEGFQAAGLAAGIKKGNTKDMALVYSEKPCVAAGTFTTNVVKAAPVKWDQHIVYEAPTAQAIVCNSGVANACTGEDDRIVGSHRIGIAHHFLCLRRSHRQYRYGSSHFFTDLKGCFQREQIVRIGPGLPGHSLHGTGFRINIHLGTRRYLFHTYYYFHTFYFFLHFLASTL